MNDRLISRWYTHTGRLVSLIRLPGRDEYEVLVFPGASTKAAELDGATRIPTLAEAFAERDRLFTEWLDK